MLVTSASRIEFGVQDRLIGVHGRRKRFSICIRDLAFADECESTLLANAIYGHVINIVFQSAR